VRWFNDDDKSFATGITLELEETEVTLRPLYVGSYLGYVFSKLINLTGLTQLPVSNFTMVGMVVFEWIISCSQPFSHC
jgi:hypothetical protein